MHEAVEKQSGWKIMWRLLKLVKPLAPVMMAGIVLGVLGFLSAIFLSVIAGEGICKVLLGFSWSWKTIFILLIVLAIARGIFHYGEQYCNHYIAFRLLALIRHQVFASLRRLCPAKLEGKEKGDLIAVITSDIELLEVFFAHTISPIAIAVLTGTILVLFIARYSSTGAWISLMAYCTIGIFIPIWNGKHNAQCGMEYRQAFGAMNTFVLDSLYGLDVLLQYGQGEAQAKKMNHRSRALLKLQQTLSRFEERQRSLTNFCMQVFIWIMFIIMLLEYQSGVLTFEGMLVVDLAMMGSFGPVLALSSLSNTLNQTLACGKRVLSLLDESPIVEEVTSGQDICFQGASIQNADFAYPEEEVLKDFSLSIPSGKIVGIHGASGSGKSTVLKLLMRFYDVQKGCVAISGQDIRKINTRSLRDQSGYMTQDTMLFCGTIASNIAIAKPHASTAEIMQAARKAGLKDFIEQLPKGLETPVGELGDTLSDGEKQRIGLARIFLHQAKFILLDEPTSNLDVLNEGIILKSLVQEKAEHTILLVSHRPKTMAVTDVAYEMASGKISA